MPRRKKLKAFTASHDGHWLTGYSVIVAEDIMSALEALNFELNSRGLDTIPEKEVDGHLTEIDLYVPQVEVLFNGDY